MGFLDDAFKAVVDPYGAASGGSVLDIIPGIGDARAAAVANKANRDEARLNREFQERMSSTAYQRAMDDMRKAGLNPTLAYMQGGASAPSGAQATIQSESKAGLGEFALKATTGIGGLRQQQTALEQQQAVNESTVQLNSANAVKAAAEAENKNVDTKLKKKGVPRAELEADISGRITKGIKSLMNRFDASAKDTKKNSEPLIKDGKGIKDGGWVDKGFKFLTKPH